MITICIALQTHLETSPFSWQLGRHICISWYWCWWSALGRFSWQLGWHICISMLMLMISTSLGIWDDTFVPVCWCWCWWSALGRFSWHLGWHSTTPVSAVARFLITSLSFSPRIIIIFLNAILCVMMRMVGPGGEESCIATKIACKGIHCLRGTHSFDLRLDEPSTWNPHARSQHKRWPRRNQKIHTWPIALLILRYEEICGLQRSDDQTFIVVWLTPPCNFAMILPPSIPEAWDLKHYEI